MQLAFLTGSPLRDSRFRGIWAGGGIYFIGNAMQTMAASWMMVELSGSSFLAALVQTAVFLPMFLFSLPAGVLADITDRRRLILLALTVQAAAGILLAGLSLASLTGPGGVLFLIFVAGSCTALMSPAWNSTVADAVPREELPQAIIATSVAYNGARALGPALAGLIFSSLGGPWNFAIAVLSTLFMMHSIRRWPPAPHPPTRLPAERLWGGMLSALRFAWHSHTVLAQLVRAAAYSGAGSALWAVLPIIGQRQLGLGAEGFGLMMGCMGTGAVIAGSLIGKMRARFGLEALVTTGCVSYALVMLIAALSRWHLPVYLALVVGGGAWMSVMSTFNTATQTSVPPWVRARAVAMHTLAALGAFAIGSAFWGALSDLAGLTVALCSAAACMAAGPLMARQFPLRMGEARDVTPATPSLQDLFLDKEPDPADGPIAVEMAYRIDPENTDDFLSAISQLRAPRRRDGATFWRVYRDLADPHRFLERFIVTSWADYLHQRARATMADHELESQVRAFLLPGEVVTMQHYIAER
jgi:MFS family permease